MIFGTYLGESELVVKVTYNFSGGRPAKLSGPMEDCTPCEPPEIEIEEVNVFGLDILDILSAEIIETITDRASVHAISAAIYLAEKNDVNEADRAGDEQRELQHWDEN